MTEKLKHRIDALRKEIEAADEPDRTALTEQLACAVRHLQVRGGRAPGRARARVSASQDAAVEEMFDNMPV